MVNELVDFAADVYSDHFGKCGADKMKMWAIEANLFRVCKRIAALEASLREHSTDVPLVAAAIVTSCETLGERRREELHAATDQKVKMIASKYGHCSKFVPHIDPPTCKQCLETWFTCGARFQR